MPDNTLRVLIVEDQEAVTAVLERAVQLLPFSRIIIKKVTKLSEALVLIETEPFDLCTLDLKLADSTSANTLKHVPQIEARCPVILVTGSMVEGFDAMLEELHIDVVKKGRGSWIDLFLASAVRTVQRGSEQQYNRMKSRLDKLRALADTIKARSSSPEQTHGST